MVRPTASLLVAFALTLTVAASGCGSDDNDTPTSPTTPVTPTTETFSGEGLNPNGARVHAFAVQAAGTVSATLTVVAPESSIGLALGTWNGTACAVTIANDSAVQGVSVIATATTAGNLCVRLYDIGKLTQATNYEVTVTHF